MMKLLGKKWPLLKLDTFLNGLFRFTIT